MITLNKPEVFLSYGLFNGGVYKTEEIKDKEKAKLIFLSCCCKERPDGAKKAVADLQKDGFPAVSYISEGIAHEFHTWRRSLYQLAQLLFK